MSWVTIEQDKRDGRYRIRWKDLVTGERRSRVAGKKLEDAQRLRFKLLECFEQGRSPDVLWKSWGDFVGEYLDRLRDRGSTAPGTVAAAAETLRQFGEACEPTGPSAVGRDDIERFVGFCRGQGNATSTVNRKLRQLRAAFNVAVRRAYILVNPLHDWDWAREEERVVRSLSDAEVAALLAACPDAWWVAFLTAALATGCRSSELLALQWRDVDLAKSQLVVRNTKGRRDRVLPLSSEVVALLEPLQASTLREGGPFRRRSYYVVRHAFRRMVTAAGIDHCTLHDLRRTFCTRVAAKAPAAILRQLAGHADIKTTLKYYVGNIEGVARDVVEALRVG